MPIDDSPSGRSAQRLALELAASCGAAIHALRIVDHAWITGGEPVPLGGMAYKVASDTEQLRESRQRMRAALDEFERLASAAGVKYSLLQREGSPQRIVEEESVPHDLIVLGRDLCRHFHHRNVRSQTTDALVRDSPRPLLVASPDASSDTARRTRIIAALDGSVPASRSLHLFCLLGLHVGREIQLLTVCQDRVGADRIISPAAALLAAHGATNVDHAIVASKAHPSDVLMSQAQAWQAGCIVMGAYGHRHVQALLMGSTTRPLLDASPVPLFIHA